MRCRQGVAMTRKKVVLINPKTVSKYYHFTSGGVDRLFEWFFRMYYDGRFQVPSHAYCTIMPPVTLYALAALFEGRCEVSLADEQVEQVDYDLDADLVCVTSTTPQILRAYEIAQHFRARGVHTAVGGAHATCLPDECARHFDTVCVGEAEGYIGELVNDLYAGGLKPRYVNRTIVSMADVPFYSYEIGGGRYLPFHVINFSRGCAFRCDFCSIQTVQGGYRTRPVDKVVERIEAVGSRNLWFPDATLTGDPQRARELFAALAPLRVRWTGQITMNVARDERMLDLMAESGCWLAGIGFESLSKLNIEAAHKTHNRVEDYARVLKALHDRNIAVEGDFVFGFDDDHEGAFDATARFVLETGVDLPEFYVLTPYPGTALHRRLHAEGRIVDWDWSHYDNTHFQHLPVYQPKHMSREALREGCRRAERRVYSLPGTLRRIAGARVMRAPVLIANSVYARRLIRGGDLTPLGEARTREQRQTTPADRIQ